MKKLIIVCAVLITVLAFSGCKEAKEANEEVLDSSNSSTGSKAGDDGFVRLPGEPSRGTNDYYIVEDICSQFTKEFISKKLGKEIVSTKGPAADGIYSCSYYILLKKIM